jgi:hypothetical protein
MDYDSKEEQGVAEGYNPVEKDYEQWEQALYPHGNGASAFDLINGDETTIRNILTYVKQNRAVLGYEVSPETGRTVKDAIIDIRNEFPQLYQAAQQPKGTAENDAYMMELANKLAEKIPKGADVGYYIKDFAKSTAPQFKNKAPAKRRQMAIAAWQDSKRRK